MICLILKPHALVRIMALVFLLSALPTVIAHADDFPPPPPGSGGAGDGVFEWVNQCTDSCGVARSNGNSEGADSGSSASNNSQIEGSDWQINGEPWCYPAGIPGEDIPFGENGWERNPNGVPGGARCHWSCGDDQIVYGYNTVFGQWEGVAYPGGNGQWDFEGVDTGITGPDGYPLFAVDGGGIPSCTEWDTSGNSLTGRERVFDICWDDLTLSGSGGGYSFSCGGDYAVRASVAMPCPSVQRQPYPRALVGTPVVFATWPGNASSASASRAWCEPTMRNYTISVRWQQLPLAPLWEFNDRSWSNESGRAQGWQAEHVYDTASFALRPIGPSTQGRLDLPAYEVSLTTYWLPGVREEWDQWHAYRFDCRETDVDCHQQAAICSGDTSIGNGDCGQWRHHSSGWIDVDPRWLGYSTPYLMRNSARDISQPPPDIPAVPTDQRQCNIPVPVIESQGLLAEP